MTVLHAREALTPSGWQRDVRIGIEDGRIAFIEAGGEARAGDERHAVALPAVPNLHSHAFQRGMAGLAERRGETADTFWTWREVMYRFALTMTPGQLEAVAGQLYMEMLEAGFSRVGEFHYLHNDRDGRPYGDIAELARRIAAAAGTTGIGLTLLPVFYAHASFGGLPPTEGQRRFITDLDGFARLLEESRSAIAGLETAVLGVAPHSLRAVTPEELAAVTAMCPAGPVHIHAAEQVREVEECLAWSGARPVQWLLDNAGIDGRWCLIHATHMTGDETRRMARAGAVAGLCPLTEASLGDGIFNGPEFTAAGGRWGVGSDSNIQIGAGDELRQLEYAQRLRLRERNVMARAGGSTGRALLEAALEGGGIAMGRPSRGLARGEAADLFTLDTENPALCERTGDALLDAWIFTGARAVDCVWVAGLKRVAGGRHVRREEITARFRQAMRELCSEQG
ncbi:formimidoylglutamate deiminase [Geminicoccaceae bacterium 1502E]|nr:formimidoylglutamate deiminase [Geminicoccaceae bacterium 1502E]